MHSGEDALKVDSINSLCHTPRGGWGLRIGVTRAGWGVLPSVLTWSVLVPLGTITQDQRHQGTRVLSLLTLGLLCSHGLFTAVLHV